MLLSLIASPACTTCEIAPEPRSALAPPPEVAERYAMPSPVQELYLAPIGNDGELRFARGALRAGDEVAEYVLLLPKAGAQPAPFVLCLPILAGGEDLIWIVGRNLAQRGYAVAWTRRIASALRNQRGVDLELLFQRTVVHNRMLLAWARAEPQLDANHMFVLGISFGGMVGTALLAVEPALRGGALCLTGGNLPDLLFATSEGRAHSWLRWRYATDGIGRADLRREIERECVSDPIRLGGYVATDKVLLVGASFDTVIPRRHQQALWESLGRPLWRTVPLGHYSAALALGPVLSMVAEFFGSKISSKISSQDAAR